MSILGSYSAIVTISILSKSRRPQALSCKTAALASSRPAVKDPGLAGRVANYRFVLIAEICVVLNVRISLYTNAGMSCPLMENNTSK